MSRSFLSLTLSFLVNACLSLSWAHAGEALRLRGSDTLGAKLMPLLSEGYRKAHPELKQGFDIAAEGSSMAFTSLLAGTADIGMSYPYSRELCLFTRVEASVEARAFITWATTADEAKKITAQVGFLVAPLRQ